MHILQEFVWFFHPFFVAEYIFGCPHPHTFSYDTNVDVNSRWFDFLLLPFFVKGIGKREFSFYFFEKITFLLLLEWFSF